MFLFFISQIVAGAFAFGLLVLEENHRSFSYISIISIQTITALLTFVLFCRRSLSDVSAYADEIRSTFGISVDGTEARRRTHISILSILHEDLVRNKTRIDQEVVKIQDRLQSTNSFFLKTREKLEKLSDFFKGSSDNISVIAASHEEIFASIKQISGSLSNQSKELIDISANVSGLCLVTEEIASAAKGVQELSEEAADFARNGKQAALKATERFQEQVGRSSNIQKIIEMIREISDKTNLLALNAAIEAARAGQHGLGFSVVADEINKLASLTMSRVNEISKDVSAMLSAQSEGHKLVTASTSHMESIADSVERIREFLRTMNTMIEEQLDGTRGMALTVNSVTEGSLQIDRAINEQNLALRELNQGVNRLVIDLNDASVDSDSTSRSTNETLIDSRHDIESREDEL
uniref:Methyl-accepting transducer domain-containing protein n=3 Tax=Leptospira ellisii TaxID=2023197 RepID=A0A2N0B8H1_9LEPT|nr:hypothetical protein CH379_11080 [Leptospira ellisii]